MSLNIYTDSVKVVLRFISHKAISHKPFRLIVSFNSTVKS